MSLINLNLFRPEPKQQQTEVRNSYFGGSLLFNGISSYNSNKALLQSTVYRCVDLISNSIAQLPIHIHEYTNDGYKREVKTGIFSLINRPSKRMNRFTFFKLLTTNVLLKGNAYALIKRDGNGNVTELQYIPTDYVTIKEKSIFDEVEYTIKGVGIVKPKDIIHLINYPSNTGAYGISTLDYAKKTLSLAFDAEDTASGYFRSGANKAGCIKLDRPITDEQEEQILSRWQQSFNATNGQANGVVVLKAGMEYQPIQMNASDAQLLETRKFNVVDICRFFGVNPTKCFDMTNSSYSTVEAQNLDYLVNTLAPLIEKFECEFNAKLWREFEEYEMRFDTSVLLRTDKAAQVNYFNSLFNMGVLSVNEIRKDLDLAPIANGDNHFMQVNISTIDKIAAQELQDNPTISNQLKEGSDDKDTEAE